MSEGEGSGPKPKAEGERTFDEVLARLDVGYKEMRGRKLHLAQESGTVMGTVPFTVEGTIITGPDGTQFDLNNMQYGGEDGLYAYLQKMSGTGDVQTWEPQGQA